MPAFGILGAFGILPPIIGTFANSITSLFVYCKILTL
jgi:ABC-type phosphate transport system permease subunit